MSNSQEIINTISTVFSDWGFKNWDLRLTRNSIVAVPRSFWKMTQSSDATRGQHSILEDKGDLTWRRYPVEDLESIVVQRRLMTASEIRIKKRGQDEDIYGSKNFREVMRSRPLLRQLYPAIYKEEGQWPTENQVIRSQKPDRFLAVLFILSLLALLPEVNSLDNTLGGLRLFILAAVAGSILGVIISLYYYFSRRKDYDGPSLVVHTIILGIIIIFSTVSISSRLNRTLMESTEYDTNFTVVSKGHSAGHKGPPQWYLFLNISNRTERIQVSEAFWNSIVIGEQLNLTLKKGYFGFPVVVNCDLTFQPAPPQRRAVGGA